MSINLSNDLLVTVSQCEKAPTPLLLDDEFSEDRSYKVLDAHSVSESSEAYFILSNNHNEIWIISNRHL